MQTVELTDTRADPAQPASLLLVEDDPHVAETLAELLELIGYCVRTASDAASALEALRTRRVAAVLCDLSLPGGMDGLGFAKACRESPELAGLHLIAVSGYDRPEDQRRAKRAGFDRLVGKPVDVERLCAAIDGGRRG